MSISVITACLNSESTIKECIDSVFSQTYPAKEHIIMDGLSADNTIQIIENNVSKITRLIIQKDQGLYDALNKGILISQGDIIGLLHSDDLFSGRDVLQKVADTFSEFNIDCLYGDLIYFLQNNPEKVIRYWKAGTFKNNSLRNGWMPPHPALFIKKEIFFEYGLFDLKYKISADYDFILKIFSSDKIRSFYLPEVLIKMRSGGISNKNLKNIVCKSREDYKTLRANRMGHPFFTLLLKNLRKLPQLRVP